MEATRKQNDKIGKIVLKLGNKAVEIHYYNMYPNGNYESMTKKESNELINKLGWIK